jgi:hypothetical protein
MPQAVLMIAGAPSMIGQTYTFSGSGLPRGHHHEIVVTKPNQRFYVPVESLHEATAAGFVEYTDEAPVKTPAIVESASAPVVRPRETTNDDGLG